MFSFFKNTKYLIIFMGIIVCLLQFTLGYPAEQNTKKISLDLRSISIQDALHILAKMINLNVIISPSIRGVTSLHLHDVSAIDAFDMLLITHDLGKWREKNIWFVGSRAELVERTQEELKLQTVLAEAAPLITRLWQINYAKAEEIARILEDNKNTLVSKRGHVRIDTRTNIVCVRDTEDRIREINRLVQRLDIPIRQILIEAHLATVDSDFERELGIHFSVVPLNSEESSAASFSAANGRYGLAVAKLANGSLLNVQLSALEKEGRGELISSPSLFTANQQTASIEAGEEIPYQEMSDSGGTAVTFKKAVLSLKVTPQIMPDNQVLLQLQVNQDKPSKRVVLGVPAINTRQISTNILVKSDQTIVLGGIYEANKEEDQQRIPFLGKIPLVGWLFRQQNVSKNKRELLIFVTPRIMI